MMSKQHILFGQKLLVYFLYILSQDLFIYNPSNDQKMLKFKLIINYVNI